MSIIIKQEELDKIADVIWWIKGARTAGMSDFDITHIEALSRLKDYHQEILDGNRPCLCLMQCDTTRTTSICNHLKNGCIYPKTVLV